MSTYNPVKELEAAGLEVDKLPAAHRDVLMELSPDEVNTLIRIRGRIQGEVQGFVRGDNNNGYFIY